MPDRGLCVLLLPAKLEASPVRERAEDLLGAPGRRRRRAGRDRLRRDVAGCRGCVRERIAAGQARRMALPGHPRAIVVFDAAQYPLARALLAEHPEAELWYGGGGGGELHEAARGRAALRFGDEPGGTARERNRPLSERMEALGRRERPARLRAGRRGLARRADLRFLAAQQVDDVARDLPDLRLAQPLRPLRQADADDQPLLAEPRSRSARSAPPAAARRRGVRVGLRRLDAHRAEHGRLAALLGRGGLLERAEAAQRPARALEQAVGRIAAELRERLLGVRAAHGVQPRAERVLGARLRWGAAARRRSRRRPRAA